MFIILAVSTVISIVGANFDCVSVKSVLQDVGFGSITVNCSDPYSVMTDCSMETFSDTESTGILGAQVVDGDCTAVNEFGAGVYAHARCCDFPASTTCYAIKSAGPSADGDTEVFTCSSNGYSVLTGCGVTTLPWSGGQMNDGSYPSDSNNDITIDYVADTDYPGTDQCKVQAGSLHEANAVMHCCNSPTYPLTCLRRYGTPATPWSVVNCPGNEQIVGCSAFGDASNVNAWYIDGSDDCVARSSGAQNVYATAICCKLATDAPTTDPTPTPTDDPTPAPTAVPTTTPTLSTDDPTRAPTDDPTPAPTEDPTPAPTDPPTSAPSLNPSAAPSSPPSRNPSTAPSLNPSASPSSAPSRNPTASPTDEPTTAPSNSPSSPPSNAPSNVPSSAPSLYPTFPPTNAPSGSPSTPPSTAPSLNPSQAPTDVPSGSPSQPPTSAPSLSPSSAPSSAPSKAPTTTDEPTTDPTVDPTIDPTADPTIEPTKDPTRTRNPTIDPTVDPTADPTVEPTVDPTVDPTADPTVEPTTDPTVDPTADPTVDPTTDPTVEPTTDPTVDPTADPTVDPTADPTVEPTTEPTVDPTLAPSAAPSSAPSSPPSTAPSSAPSLAPSSAPSSPPTAAPSTAPSLAPSNAPSDAPSRAPTTPPSNAPSVAPSNAPSDAPSTAPSSAPTTPPSNAPSDSPTDAPSLNPTLAPSTAPTELCTTMIVKVASISNSNPTISIEEEHWNGHYIESDAQQYNRPKWYKDTGEDPLNNDGSIGWIPPSTWMLYSGITTHELLYPDDKHLHPPTGQSSTWYLSIDSSVTVQIELECSESIAPTHAPTNAPSSTPSQPPTTHPSLAPSQAPSVAPTETPTDSPSQPPTQYPTDAPSITPSTAPSDSPTQYPSNAPSITPSMTPSQPPSLSPTTYCELLRVRITNVVDSETADTDALLETLQALLYTSFEQKRLFSIHYRTYWIQHGGCRVQYDSFNDKWIIYCGSYKLDIVSTEEMPPSDADWTVYDYTNDNIETSTVSVSTECTVFTDAPTIEPSHSPVTGAPTKVTVPPSVLPSVSPSTSEPTTAIPTVMQDDECDAWSFVVQFLLLEWMHSDYTEQQITNLCLITAINIVGTFEDEWCIAISDVVFEDVSNEGTNRRRILQTDVDVYVRVSTTFSVNNALFDAYFDHYNENKFLHSFQGIITPQLTDNGGGAMNVLNISGVVYSGVITTTQSTEETQNGAVDLPFGLSNNCGAFELLCWQLYSGFLGFVLLMILIVVCVVHKTNKDIASGKFYDLKSEPASMSGADVEMQPTGANVAINKDGDKGTENFDL